MTEHLSDEAVGAGGGGELLVADPGTNGFPVGCSKTIARLAEALAKAQGEFPGIGKDKQAIVQMKTGGKYTYAYADLASVMEAVRPVLSKHGLSTMQPIKVENRGVIVSTLLLHGSGEWIVSDPLPLAIGDASDPRSVGSAISYARRYSLMALLGLAAGDEDDDGERGAPRGNSSGSANGVGQQTAPDRRDDARTGPQPAQRKSEPSPPAPPPSPIGIIKTLQDLPSGVLAITLDTGFRCGTRNEVFAADLRTHHSNGTKLELVTKAARDQRFAPSIEAVKIVEDQA